MDKHPTLTDPVPELYLLPLKNYIFQLRDVPEFFHDFLYTFPFTTQLIEHFQFLTRSLTIFECWKVYFRYIAIHYTPHEICDLIYETFYELHLGHHYLKYLVKNNHYHIWPSVDYFLNPLLSVPPRIYLPPGSQFSQ